MFVSGFKPWIQCAPDAAPLMGVWQMKFERDNGVWVYQVNGNGPSVEAKNYHPQLTCEDVQRNKALP
jgi:hypothetical protein